MRNIVEAELRIVEEVDNRQEQDNDQAGDRVDLVHTWEEGDTPLDIHHIVVVVDIHLVAEDVVVVVELPSFESSNNTKI